MATNDLLQPTPPDLRDMSDTRTEGADLRKYHSGKQQQYPDVDSALSSYHNTEILARISSNRTCQPGACVSRENFSELVADNIEEVTIIANRNTSLSVELFAALNPIDLNTLPVFLYGNMTRPEVVASIICDKSECRTYEQAVRMTPARLLEHKLTNFREGSTVVGAQPGKDCSAAGVLLFGTMRREREPIRRHKGSTFVERNAKAEIKVGNDLIQVNVLAYAWRGEIAQFEETKRRRQS